MVKMKNIITAALLLLIFRVSGQTAVGYQHDANGIQNDFIHNAFNSPHFINKSFGVYPCGGYWPKRQYSLW
jgi:hypothetical protein